MCDYDSYINGGQVRFEGNQGRGDDTALNGLKISCKNIRNNKEQLLTVYEGDWGEWMPMLKKNNLYVVGAQCRYQDY